MPINISFRLERVLQNLLTFCLSEKFFIFPLILNDAVAGYCILDFRFFHLSTLILSYHLLLDYRVSAEKSADRLMGIPLYMTLFFPCSL